ncbi:MAG: KOW domain-containing protein [Roseburia sp.]
MNLAKVKAGHDKNHYYLILEEGQEYVLLVNGTTKPLAKPKKKNKKHIQIIKRIPESIMISETVSQSDTEIADLLHQYEQYLAETGEKTKW